MYIGFLLRFCMPSKEQLQSDGGKNMRLLDSNEMWQDPVFRQSFSKEFQAKGVPG